MHGGKAGRKPTHGRYTKTAIAGREEVRAILARDGVRTTPSDWAPLALTVEEGDAISHPLVRSGRLAVVDAAAQALVELVPKSEVVVDLTAAPGGKTRTLLARGKARRVIALERQGARVLRLARNLSDGLRRDTGPDSVTPAKTMR